MGKRRLERMLVETALHSPDCHAYMGDKRKIGVIPLARQMEKSGCMITVEQPRIPSNLNPAAYNEYKRIRKGLFKVYPIPTKHSAFFAVAAAYMIWKQKRLALDTKFLEEFEDESFRPEVIQLVLSNKGRFQNVASKDSAMYNRQFRSGNGKEYWAAYELAMARTATAGHRELQAMSDVLGCAIHVYTSSPSSNAFLLKEVFSPHSRSGKVPLLRLTRRLVNQMYHFDVMYPSILEYQGKFWQQVYHNILKKSMPMPM